MKLSVCLIVRDEEAVLERCLGCAALFADEIIITDTGSADGTVEIAKKFTDSVYFFEWNDDFSAARNFCFSKASGDFLMWLDADDVVTEENAEKINRLKNNGDFDVAYLLYAAAFDGDLPTFTYYRERIFRRSMNFRWVGAVHEAIEPRGRVVYSDACIFHKKVRPNPPMRNLRIFQKLISDGKPLDERQKFYYGRELFFNGMYAESCAVLEGFLNGDGWVENKAEACITLYMAYYALGERERALLCLLRGFTFGVPKSRSCCILGGYFLEKKEYEAAEFWYKTAATISQNIRSGAFVEKDYSGFIPYMQLCVLYDRLGNFKKARYYNELAGSIKPHDKNYLHNKQYFLTKLKE